MKTITSITYDEYLQALGLLTLATQHNQSLDGIRSALLAMVDERDTEGKIYDCGHTADAVYGDGPASSRLAVLLDRLEIAVEKPIEKPVEKPEKTGEQA